MYKEDLALNNLQWLICHRTKPNQTEDCWFSNSIVVIFSSEEAVFMQMLHFRVTEGQF